MIRLTTPRLLIRDHVQEDLQTHHQLLSDPKAMWFLQDIMTHSLQQSQSNLQHTMDQAADPNRECYFLRIEDRLTQAHIGEIGYTVAASTPLGKLVDVGYFIRDTQWGLGYTTEALNALIQFAFMQDGVCRIACGCLKENAASERVMQKCGMVKEAHYKQYQWHDGALKDRVQYRMLHSEWSASNPD